MPEMGEIKETKRAKTGGNGLRADKGQMQWTDSGCSFPLPGKETGSSVRIELKQTDISDAQKS